MKSWKTTLTGICTIGAGLFGGIKLCINNQVTEGVSLITVAVSTGIGLITARDNNRTSEDVGADVKK